MFVVCWTLEHARGTLAAQQDDYNQQWPHGSLGHLTPSEFAQRGQAKQLSRSTRFQLKTVAEREERFEKILGD